MDEELESLRFDLQEMGISLNTTAANEHSPLIERQIRVIKKHVRAIKHSLPFTVIPQIMLIEMIYYGLFWLNEFSIEIWHLDDSFT